MSEIINVPMAEQRDIQTVTVEIRQLHRQAQSMALGYAIEIGRRLTEAKSMLEHGQWTEWLRTEVPFGQSTAQNFMRIFDAYGADQVNFFGDAKSQTLGNLPYTKALRLLAIDDEEEREAFVETHDVENMSSRELEQAIRERDEALRRAEAAEERLLEAEDADTEKSDALRESRDALEKEKEKADAFRVQAEGSEKRMEKYRQEAEKAQEEARNAQEKLKDAQEKLKNARDKLKEAQDKPVEIPAEELEKIRAEEAAKAEDAVKAAEARAEQLRRELAAADGDTAVFKAHFEAVQRDFSAMGAVYTRVREKDAERAGKLKAAVKAVLDKLSGDVEGTW